ncbi:TlpA family protein disulfide reductase [Chitinophaga lutea]
MRYLILLLAVIFGGPLRAQVTVSPERPQRGQTVTVTFNPAKPVQGPVLLNFTYSNFYDQPWKMPLQHTGKGWTASFKLAPYAVFATFQVQAGDSLIQPGPGRHYEIAVYDDKGKPVRDGRLYRGYSLSAQMGRSPELAAAQGDMYKQELADFPDNYEAKLRLLQYRMSQSKGAEREAFRQEAHKVIADRFNAAPTVAGNINKVTMGYLIIGENSRLDSIRNVIRERYPESSLGRELWTSYIAKGKDTARQIVLFEKALKQENKENASSFAAMHEQLFDYYAAAGKATPALLHARKVADDDRSPYRPHTLKKIARTLLDNRLAFDSAYSYASEALAMADSFPAGVIRYFPETGYIFPFVSDSLRQATTATAKGNMESMLGLIALEQARSRPAGKAKLESPVTLSNDVKSKAEGHMRRALEASRDKETLDNVEQYYTATSDEAGLKALREYREKAMLDKVKKMLTSRPAPSLAAFTDLQGKPLDTASLKGKIVVIDFWATWCIPCMQEMPYLQKVYDHFKQRPDVAFLVVNSGARNTLADAQGWSGNKKYTFPVYYNTDPAVGDKFRFNVIPATYVIDKNGQLRFGNIGFEGPDVELKLKMQIDLLSGN